MQSIISALGSKEQEVRCKFETGLCVNCKPDRDTQRDLVLKKINLKMKNERRQPSPKSTPNTNIMLIRLWQVAQRKTKESEVATEWGLTCRLVVVSEGKRSCWNAGPLEAEPFLMSGWWVRGRKKTPWLVVILVCFCSEWPRWARESQGEMLLPHAALPPQS